MTKDRRNNNRTFVSRPVVIHTKSGQKVRAYITNVSETGLFILTHMPAEVGALLQFSFSLPVKNQMHHFVLKGKIVYCVLKGDKYGSGVALLKVSDDDKSLIKKFRLEAKSKIG